MTQFLNKSFSVNMSGDDQYRSNWEAVFGKSTEKPEAEWIEMGEPVSDIRLQVEAFREAFGQPSPDQPVVPPDDRVRLCLRLIAEEFFELLEACVCEGDPYLLNCARGYTESVIEHDEITVDLVKVADALADLDYVNEGFRLESGINGLPISEEVHKSNMSKLGGPIVNGKIQKPEGWSPPDIKGELRKQGW